MYSSSRCSIGPQPVVAAPRRVDAISTPVSGLPIPGMEDGGHVRALHPFIYGTIYRSRAMMVYVVRETQYIRARTYPTSVGNTHPIPILISCHNGQMSKYS